MCVCVCVCLQLCFVGFTPQHEVSQLLSIPSGQKPEYTQACAHHFPKFPIWRFPFNDIQNVLQHHLLCGCKFYLIFLLTVGNGSKYYILCWSCYCCWIKVGAHSEHYSNNWKQKVVQHCLRQAQSVKANWLKWWLYDQAPAVAWSLLYFNTDIFMDMNIGRIST